MDKKLIEILKEKDIEPFINTVKKSIPDYTLAYLNQQTDNDIGNTPATLHDVMYNNNPIPIILFSYGFIYLGSTWGFEKWKVIWFENINAVNIIDGVSGPRVEIKGIHPEKPDKQFVLTSYGDKLPSYKNFGDFICKLEAFLKFFSDSKISRKSILVNPIELCGRIRGGRRKTKQSKRITRNKRNKKCKRRTRRS